MHLRTISGRAISPVAPTIADIDRHDIAHALGHVCRFGGHVSVFYSVAQHSVLVSYAVPPELALWGLLHDASEAYLVDVPTPVKQTSALAGYGALEAQMQQVIYQAFGLVGAEPHAVRIADAQLLVLEARALQHAASADAIEADAREAAARGQFLDALDKLPPFQICPVKPVHATRAFLARLAELTSPPQEI